MPSLIDTPPKRTRLGARRGPYWQSVAGGRGGISVGYRRTAKGPGVWVAKLVIDGERVEERLGQADDNGASDQAQNYRAAVAAALDWATRKRAALEARKVSGSKGAPTVRSAVEAYIDNLTRRNARSGATSRSRMLRHLFGDAFADVKLSKLRASTIEDWRGRLPLRKAEGGAGIGPSTENRLVAEVRAALNAAIERHRRELPAHLSLEVRIGTRASAVQTVARKQILSDAQVRAVIAAAFAVDKSGDFGALVLVAAATGARYSQITRMLVGDVQTAGGRLMLPGSSKGRTPRTKPKVAIPVAPNVIARLAPVLSGRDPSELLLQRWRYRRGPGISWIKDRRVPWGPAYEFGNLWAAAVKAADLPAGSIMYALRHSSIVRALRLGLPVRLVAALHDTSSDMIEKHYSAYIVDATEDLARRAVFAIAAG